MRPALAYLRFGCFCGKCGETKRKADVPRAGGRIVNALRPEPVWRAGAECTRTNFDLLHLYVSVFRDKNSRAGLFSGTAFLLTLCMKNEIAIACSAPMRIVKIAHRIWQTQSTDSVTLVCSMALCREFIHQNFDRYRYKNSSLLICLFPDTGLTNRRLHVKIDKIQKEVAQRWRRFQS